MRRTVAAAMTVALTLAGCTDGDAADDPSQPDTLLDGSDAVREVPSTAESPSATESAAGIDVTTVPPVDGMTAEYVEAVANEIEAAAGRLFAAVLAEPVNPAGTVPAGTAEGLGELFAGDAAELRIESATALAASEDARALVLPASEYVGVRYLVEQVSYAEPSCIIAVARVDRTGSQVDGRVDPVLALISLSPSATAGSTVNDTAWMVVGAISNTDSNGEPNPDEFALGATLGDVDGVLSHTCTAGEASRLAP